MAKFKPWLKVKLTLKPFYSDKQSQHRSLRQEHWFELRTQPPPPQNHREQFFCFRTRGEMQFLVSTEFWIKSAQSSLHRIIRNKNSPLPPLYKILPGMTIISKTHISRSHFSECGVKWGQVQRRGEYIHFYAGMIFFTNFVTTIQKMVCTVKADFDREFALDRLVGFVRKWLLLRHNLNGHN